MGIRVDLQALGRGVVKGRGRQRETTAALSWLHPVAKETTTTTRTVAQMTSKRQTRGMERVKPLC